MVGGGGSMVRKRLRKAADPDLYDSMGNMEIKKQKLD